MREKKIPKQILHTKMEGKRPRERSRSRGIDHIRKDIEMRGENWEEIQENRNRRIEIALDFSVNVVPYLWKWLMNDDGEDDDETFKRTLELPSVWDGTETVSMV